MNDRVVEGRRAKVLLYLTLVACPYALGAGQQRLDAVQAGTLSVPAYAQEIDRWSAELAKAKEQPENVAMLSRQVPPDWQVMVGAQIVKVPTDWLRSGLEFAGKNPRTTAQSIDRLLTRLEAMRREALALAEQPRGPDESAPGKLRAILARPEFREIHGPTWLDRIGERARKWLRAFLDRLAQRMSGHERIAWFFRLLPWAVLVCAAGGLLAWMVWLLLRRSTARLLELGVPRPASILGPSWQQMMEAARKAGAAGEYREAIRLAYLTALHHLEVRKVWRVDPARTHREYLRMVPREQPEHEPLALLTRQFELTWYGSQPATPGDFKTAVNQLERLGCA